MFGSGYVDFFFIVRFSFCFGFVYVFFRVLVYFWRQFYLGQEWGDRGCQECFFRFCCFIYSNFFFTKLFRGGLFFRFLFVFRLEGRINLVFCVRQIGVFEGRGLFWYQFLKGDSKGGWWSSVFCVRAVSTRGRLVSLFIYQVVLQERVRQLVGCVYVYGQ